MGNQTTNNFSLTASHLLEYLYCPRFTYFEYIMDIPQNEGNRFKVQKGRDIHEITKKRNPNYLRKKFGAIDKKSDVYLASQSGIRGIVDEILFMGDGTAVPVDFKYAEYKKRTFKHHKFQLIFYARLIKDNFQIPVNRGFIIYTRSKNKLVEVPLKDKDFIELEKIIDDMTSIIQNCRYPRPTSVKRRCLDCCYKNICESTI